LKYRIKKEQTVTSICMSFRITMRQHL